MARIILILALLPVLAACGVRGGLQTPDPLWGDANRAPPPVPKPYEADRRGRESISDPLQTDFNDENFGDLEDQDTLGDDNGLGDDFEDENSEDGSEDEDGGEDGDPGADS